MLVLGDVLCKCLAEFGDGERGDGDMDVRDQVTVRFDRKEVVKRRFVVEMKGFDVIVLVEFLGGDNAFGGQVKGEDTRLMAEGEVARHTNQDKSDGHEWAIGIEGPADDSDEKKEDDNSGTWPKLERIVFRGVPVEKDVAVARV